MRKSQLRDTLVHIWIDWQLIYGGGGGKWYFYTDYLDQQMYWNLWQNSGAELNPHLRIKYYFIFAIFKKNCFPGRY